MISNAVALALLTTAGFWCIWRKLPRKVRRFIIKHNLAADVVALLLTYMLLGGTLTALTAGALVGLLTSALLYVAENESEFLYLSDFGDWMKDRLSSVKSYLKEAGEQYRQKKLAEANGVA